MQQALNFFPEPHGQRSFLPTFFPTLRTGSRFFSVDCWLPAMAASWTWRMPPETGTAAAASCESADWWIVWARSSFQCDPRYERNSGSKCSTRKIRSVAVGDAVPHLGEDAHALALVLDLGVDLSIALQADGAPQVVHRSQVLHPACVENLQQDDLFHLAHFGAMLGVQGVDQQDTGVGGGQGAQLVGGRLDTKGLMSPGGQIGQGRGVASCAVLLPTRRRRIGRVEPVIQLVGQRSSLVSIMSLLEQESLDLGPQQRPDLSGVDDGVEPFRRPGR